MKICDVGNKENFQHLFPVVGKSIRVTPLSCRCPLKCENRPPADRKVIDATSLLVTNTSVEIRETTSALSQIRRHFFTSVWCDQIFHQ